MAKLNGTLYAAYAGAGSEKILHTTAASLSTEQDLVDAHTKESGGHSEHIRGVRSWSIDFSGACDETGTGLTHNELMALIIAGSVPAAIEFKPASGTSAGWSGTGTIRNMKITGEKEGVLQFAGSIQSSGSMINLADYWPDYWSTREPSGAAATITGSSTATVTWTDSAVSGADGYRVYADAVLKATVAVGAQTADVSGLTAETEYVFKVVAYKGTQESTGDTDTQTTWNALFDDLTVAWPLSESGMRREVLGTGLDFFPYGATSDGDFTIFDGTNDHLVCGDGIYKLGADTPFTMAFTVKPTATSGTKWIASKGMQSNATNCEWYIYHNGTQVYFRMNDGSSDVTVTDATNRIAAGVETKIVVGKDTVNNLISIKIGNNAPVTTAFTVNTVPNHGGIVIGTDLNFNAANYYNGAVKDLMIWNGIYLTTAQQATLYGLSFPATPLPAQAATLDPDDLATADKYSRHDFSDLTRMFTDAAKTANVVSDNDPIRVIASRWGSHDWVAPSDGVRPLYKSNIQGGLGVGLWDGGDSELDFDAPVPGDDDFTLFLLVRNLDNASAAGSQILHNSATSSNYLALTGTDYGTGAYFAIHTTTGDSVTTAAPVNNAAGFNLVELKREGDLYTINQNGKNDNTNTCETLTGDILFDEMGPLNAPNWWFDGYCAEMIWCTRQLTFAEICRIRAFLTAKWTIANVQYYPL